MTEREKMLAGELYRVTDPELREMHYKALSLTKQYNDLDPLDAENLAILLHEICHAGEGVEIKQPVRFDYGCHTYIGDRTFINYGFNCLDVCEVRIGSGVLIGPNVQLYAATHPIDPAIRRQGLENGKPITIGDNVWIGGGTIVCPGVSIGDDSTIGAGSVVTKDIPPNSVAVGNPCRVVKTIETR